jgi:hypothetical protein
LATSITGFGRRQHFAWEDWRYFRHRPVAAGDDRQLSGSPAFPLLIRYQLMKIDENTPGSIAHQEAVRVLKGWLLTLYFADCLVCTFVALGKGQSLSYGFWLLFKSLFFSYGVGIVLLVIVNKFFLRLIGITKPTPVGFLRYCVLLAFISVIMGGVLAYGISPVGLTMRTEPAN